MEALSRNLSAEFAAHGMTGTVANVTGGKIVD